MADQRSGIANDILVDTDLLVPSLLDSTTHPQEVIPTLSTQARSFALVHTVRMLPGRFQTEASVGASWFADTKFIPPDAIFALTALYNKDPSPSKVNLGQGTYRDDAGKPWILPAVQEARKQLFDGGLNHEYLPILGLKEFRERVAQLALGPCYATCSERLSTCQSLSGTGGLHLTGLLLKSCRSPSTKIYIPDPTWSNHHQVFETLGFPCESFPYYDYSKKTLDINSYLTTLQNAEPGSIVVLHACAHNPTGYDPTQEQWRDLGRIMKERKLFPLFDAAYLGFNSGNIDEDAFAIRYFVDKLEMEVAVCMSFAKNMGLYGERVGCVVIVSDDPGVAMRTQSTLEMIQRSEVSNPPAFGAKIASTILGSKDLSKAWYDNLNTMSGRIREMRTKLFDELVKSGARGSWVHLKEQTGMFGFLGLSPEIVTRLREEFHIYMASNSRISIAGLNMSNVEYVAHCIKACLINEV